MNKDFGNRWKNIKKSIPQTEKSDANEKLNVVVKLTRNNKGECFGLFSFYKFRFKVLSSVAL